MSVAEVARVRGEKLEPTGPSSNAHLQFFNAPAQSYEELGPCSVVYGFFEDRLFQIRFDCSGDQRVSAVLRRELGPPTSVTASQEVWLGEHTGTAMSRASKAFSFADNAIARAMNAYILGLRARPPSAESAAPAHPSH